MLFNSWKRYAILLVILLGFILRLELAQHDPEQRIRGDENTYTRLAQQLLTNPFEYTNVFRPPVYPSFLAVSTILFGGTRFATGVFQALVAAISMAVIYALSKLLFRRTGVAVLAAFLYAISLELAALTRLFYGETLFLMLSLVGFWLIIKWVRSPRPALMLIAGIFVALAALTREVIGIFGVVVVPVWFFIVLAPQWKQALLKSAFFALGLALLFVPWSIRNAGIEGRFIFIGTSGEHNFAIAQARVETKVGIVPDLTNVITSVNKNGKTVVHYQPQIYKEISEQPPPLRGAYAFQRGMTVIRHDPIRWFFVKLDGVRAIVKPAAKDLRYVRLENMSPELQLWFDATAVFYVLGVLGLGAVGMLLARDNAPKLLILLYILFNLGIFILTHYQPRYRLPLTVLLLPYAAYAMVRLVDPVVSRLRNSNSARVSQTP